MSADTDPSVPLSTEELDKRVPSLGEHYKNVRAFTGELCEPLVTEDYVIQTMDDVSPTKWHLAHTSWFFETFVLSPHYPGYKTPNPQYRFLFNSYYNAVGGMHRRDSRGFISRPTVAEVLDYRAHVDENMAGFFEDADRTLLDKLAGVVEIGIHHEQQHQELILTDLKHVFSVNPLRPKYRDLTTATGAAPSLRWLDFPEGLRTIGHDGDGFSYDNEKPRHQVFVHPFQLGSRLVTNEEYMAFIDDGGYKRPELWLSDGWQAVQEHGWTAPLYWEKRDGTWWTFTVAGMRELSTEEPVCHVSYFEADAYARWAGGRLPTECEWEVASDAAQVAGNFAERRRYHPTGTTGEALEGHPQQMFGDVWEWTQSPYTAYPGYRPPEGALGEYNGKFMCNQYVLRGGSCATSQTHIRRTYRNFFPASARWQFSGLRLARDANS